MQHLRQFAGLRRKPISSALMGGVALLAAILTVLPSPIEHARAADAGAAVVFIGGLKALVGDLKRLANDAAAAGDQVLQNRIEQAVTSLELVLHKIDDAIKQGKKDINQILDEGMSEASGLLSDLHDDGSVLGNFASTKLNLAIANGAALFDDVPFIEVDPAVLALVPTRIEKKQRARRIRLFGYFPGDVEDDIRIAVNGLRVEKVLRKAASSLEFSLPESLALNEEQLISIDVEVDKHYGPFDLLWKTHTFNESVLVGKAQPFQCNVVTYGENPDYLQIVEGTTPAQFSATTQSGNNRPNENRNVSAKDLFFQTMGAAAASYDPASIRIVDAGAQLLMYGACNGKGPHGRVEVTNSGLAVAVSLHAPHLPASIRVRGVKVKRCDAGGTHAKAILRPKFQAAKKDAQPLKSVDIKSYALGPSGLNEPHTLPPAGDWALHAKCSFQEGDESWFTRTMILNPSNKQATARAMTTRIDNDRLLIEPLNPLAFEDKLR